MLFNCGVGEDSGESVHWTGGRSNRSILKEISPKYSFKGLMLKLKLQYFGHLMRRAKSLQKTLMLGKIEGKRKEIIRKWDDWMVSSTQWTWIWENSGRWWRTGRPGVCCSPWGCKEGNMSKQLNNKMLWRYKELCLLLLLIKTWSYINMKKNIYARLSESLCCTEEINTTL